MLLFIFAMAYSLEPTAALFSSSDILLEAVINNTDEPNSSKQKSWEGLKDSIQLVRPTVPFPLNNMSYLAIANQYYHGTADFFPEHSNYSLSSGIIIRDYHLDIYKKGINLVIRKAIFQALLPFTKDDEVIWVIKNNSKDFTMEQLSAESGMARIYQAFINTTLKELVHTYFTLYQALFVNWSE